MAKALWIVGRERAELRLAELLGDLGGDMVEVEALFSGISRGTERLVFSGKVPASEHERMRCPFQDGDFPFPVKYGYASVGRVVGGPAELAGRIVFALFPHQDRYPIPAELAHVLPDGLPPERAVLAANMETALNILWDSGAGPGDRVAVVGAGVVGLLAACLAGRLPGAEVTVVDINQNRAAMAERLGAAFALPEAAPADCDVVIHASASAAGLKTAIAAAGTEARIVEASWYGETAVEVGLGGAFHSRRLQLVSSQVGMIPAARRARWDFSRRLGTALKLLAGDDRLDALISGESAFAALDENYGRILADPATLCHRIRYD